MEKINYLDKAIFWGSVTSICIGLLGLMFMLDTSKEPKPDCCDQRIKQLQKSFDSTHSKCFRYVSEKEGWR